MWTIFKVFIKFVAALLLFDAFFFFFGLEACGILIPWSEIQPTLPALEAEVLTTGLQRSPSTYLPLFLVL